MQNERQLKIGLLSRASKGKARLPNYLAALSAITGSSVTAPMLTPLKDRDRLLQAFRSSYLQTQTPGRTAFSKTYDAENKRLVSKLMNCSTERLDEPVYLLTKDSEICGAVQISIRLVLPHWEALLSFDGDAIMVLSEDSGEGLLLDYTPDDVESCYELTAWGNRWPIVFRHCSGEVR